MGKKNKKAKKKIVSKAKQSTQNSTGDSSPTVFAGKPTKFSADQLLDKAEEFSDTFQYDLANKFVQRALEAEPQHLRGLEMCGTLCLETGDMDGAKNCFQQAASLEPNVGHSKYMYLGQLLTGQDAVDSYLKGIELMKKDIAQSETQADAAACADSPDELTNRDVSSAYCAIAEIYLTDECFDEDAENKCKEFLEQAVNIDVKNPEAHHLMASFYLSIAKDDEARKALEKGVALWLPVMQAASEPDAVTTDAMNVCDVSYPARVNAAKLLIEVANYDLAAEVLELLLDEEDEVVEVWYLLGWLNYLQGEEYKCNSRFYLTKANQVAKKCGCEDEQITQHIAQLLEELGPEESQSADEDEEDGDKELECSDNDSDNNMDTIDLQQNETASKDTSDNHDAMDL